MFSERRPEVWSTSPDEAMQQTEQGEDRALQRTGEHRDEGGQGEHKDEGRQGVHKDEGRQGVHKDEGRQGEQGGDGFHGGARFADTFVHLPDATLLTAATWGAVATATVVSPYIAVPAGVGAGMAVAAKIVKFVGDLVPQKAVKDKPQRNPVGSS
eukprot:TRINITY_DN4742_c0_g1_i4.p2 TRINITY_DN4742_c0_g1~~TRINITY_DN4742_c0_g1_i4.p2  ORF type:complete len:155 (+),score=14.70 TRINITY_DN4742_c0_g1_i4:71-535(+)